MVLGWERINSKKSTPNKNIVFIKPLTGPQEDISKDYLERIAAQCLPIMNKHHLAVVSLEEYEPNREFWGRCFNNGEIIQLVLRAPSTGHWLPFTFVQMVMMHELAHIKQMNHSKAFWAVRNEFSTEMKALWDRGYTGDGLWGRGMLLENGLFDCETLEERETLPEHMCGGTFKSRGSKKRTAKPKITYKEQKERRIKRKFGVNGIALGADEETKTQLEKGKRTISKPRVASSARGRELRAAAALARFEVKNDEPEIMDEDLVTDSETEYDGEEDFVIKTEPDDAIDINGQLLLDTKGHRVVRVCEDEDKDDDGAKNELQELQDLPRRFQPSSSPKKTGSSSAMSSVQTTSSGPLQTSKSPKQVVKLSSLSREPSAKEEARVSITLKDETVRPAPSHPANMDEICPICSVVNERTALTCMVCSNVLKSKFVPGCWRCKSSTCQGSDYVNAGDVTLCGICGLRKSLDQ